MAKRQLDPPPGIARRIVIDRDSAGAPRITLGDTVLGYLTTGISVEPPSLKGMATVTITFLAERVEVLDDKPRTVAELTEWLRQDVEAHPEMAR